MSLKNVLVTVGTTNFDALLTEIDSAEVQRVLRDRFGVTSIVVQRGKLSGLSCAVFDFKADLLEDIRQADFVISHCGAGSLLEILRARKKAVAVINHDLLDNHQTELANAMEDQNLMRVARSPQDLVSVLSVSEWDSIKAFEDPDRSLFLSELSSLIRLS